MLMRFLDFGLLRNIRLDLHACTVSQLIQGFLEIKPVALHHEFEDVAALITLTKTAPRSSLWPDDEGRRVFVVVEWTETCIVPARMAQFDASLRDEVYDVNAGFNFVNGGHMPCCWLSVISQLNYRRYQGFGKPRASKKQMRTVVRICKHPFKIIKLP